jgi:hypothetical protein
MAPETAANIKRLTKIVGEYNYVFEFCASKVRGLPQADLQNAYDKAVQRWQGVMEPPKDDEKKRKEFFAMCDSICNSNPTTPEE